MPIWTANDDPTGRPKYANNSNVYGVDRTEARVKNVGIASGWVAITPGTGYVTMSLVSGGSGYANTDVVKVDGGATPGVVNATANVIVGFSANSAGTVNIVGVNATATGVDLVTTGYANGDVIFAFSNSSNSTVRTINQVVNSTFMNVTSAWGFSNTTSNFGKAGVIQQLTNATPGSGFQTTANVSFTTSAGVRANVAATLGGRAGRTDYETMVIVKNMTNDAADDTILPDS